MKITDLTLTLFRWQGIPPTSYNEFTGQFGGATQLGLLAVRTDEGIEGHAFLGSSMFSADQDGPGLGAEIDFDLIERKKLAVLS